MVKYFQDYPENMELHRDNKRYLHWNTENTAKILHKKFPNSLIFIIKPTRMHLMTFAVYSNFFQTNDFGSPTHCGDHGAIRHLSSLYSSAVGEVYKESQQEPVTDLAVHLIGFSKGCTVLNQVVLELHLLENNSEIKNFVKTIKSFYWLDGGHSGGKDNTWVTDDSALRQLASLDCQIYIHVSPYQVGDPMRKWIGQQENKFYKKLLTLKAKVQETHHFEMEPSSIENHFKVLEEF